jgi:hypothetical protein
VSGPHIQAGYTLVTLQDLRAARYCLAGARLFCRQHGLDWADFLVHGVSAQALRATGDAQVEAVIAAALARAARASEHCPPATGPTPDGE